MCAISLHDHIGETERSAVCRKDGCVIAVEVRLIALAGITGFDDCGIGPGDLFAVRCDRVAAVLTVFNSLCCLNLFLCGTGLYGTGSGYFRGN